MHCFLSYKVLCTQWTLIFVLVTSGEEMLNLPRAGSSEGLQKVLTTERTQCVASQCVRHCSSDRVLAYPDGDPFQPIPEHSCVLGLVLSQAL